MKTLIVYFSRAGQNWFDGKKIPIDKGNTEVCAEFLQEITGGDLLKLEMVSPYSDNYDTCCDQALKDQQTNARPALKKLPESISEYDTIYLGYPIYWSLAPMCVLTFLEHYDFTGKTIYPFSTHEGSGLGASVSIIRKVAKGASVLDPLPIPGTLAPKSKNALTNWVNKH